MIKIMTMLWCGNSSNIVTNNIDGNNGINLARNMQQLFGHSHNSTEEAAGRGGGLCHRSIIEQ